MRSSGTRGYSGYRGRRPDNRRWVVLVLVLILIAALAFLAVQRYLVFDKGGSYHFELPWVRHASPKETGKTGGRSLEIVIEEPEEPGQAPVTEPLHALELDPSVLQGDMTRTLSALGSGVNSLAIRLKTVDGDLLYPSSLPEAVEAKAVSGSSMALSAIEALNASNYYTIARLSMLHDSRYSFAHMTDAAVLQLSYRNYIWYAPDSSFYLAPEKELARSYLVNVAREVAAMGFDELLLDEFSYPPSGRLNNIDASKRDMSMEAALSLLVDQLRSGLSEYDVCLSLTMEAADVLAGGNERRGQSLAQLGNRFDRIYVPCTEDQLEALRAAMEPYAAELVPILPAAPAAADGPYLISE